MSGLSAATRPSKAEWIIGLIVVPALTLVFQALLFGDRLWHEPGVWMRSFPVICGTGLLTWYVLVLSVHGLQRRFSGIGQTSWRFLSILIATLLLMSFSFAAHFYVYDEGHYLNYRLNREHLGYALLTAVALAPIVTTMWESDNMLRKWKASLAEKETLEQLAIRQEFNTLKHQINPHFLFNCFNTLSSLITYDPQRAETFLNELSKVYRYLLQQNEHSLSTVQQEVRFIHSYLKLLQTRYGSAIEYDISVDKKYDDYLLPSLSLQLLVENAVKHNALSKGQPLQLDIFTTEGNKLVVNNNLQPRSVPAASHGIGLENIRNKYGLLRQQGFQVVRDAKNFTVALPLIWQEAGIPAPVTSA